MQDGQKLAFLRGEVVAAVRVLRENDFRRAVRPFAGDERGDFGYDFLRFRRAESRNTRGKTAMTKSPSAGCVRTSA
mgnify:CR=1 FL=1